MKSKLKLNDIRDLFRAIFGVIISVATMPLVLAIGGHPVSTSTPFTTLFFLLFIWCLLPWLPLLGAGFSRKLNETFISGVLAGCVSAIPFLLIQSAQRPIVIVLVIVAYIALPCLLMALTRAMWDRIHKMMKVGFRASMKIMATDLKLYSAYGLLPFIVSVLMTAVGLKLIAPYVGFATGNFISGVLEAASGKTYTTLYDYQHMVSFLWLAIESLVVGFFMLNSSMSSLGKEGKAQKLNKTNVISNVVACGIAGLLIGTLSILVVHIVSAFLFVGVVLPVTLSFISAVAGRKWIGNR